MALSVMAWLVEFAAAMIQLLSPLRNQMASIRHKFPDHKVNLLSENDSCSNELTKKSYKVFLQSQAKTFLFAQFLLFPLPQPFNEYNSHNLVTARNITTTLSATTRPSNTSTALTGKQRVLKFLKNKNKIESSERAMVERHTAR